MDNTQQNEQTLVVEKKRKFPLLLIGCIGLLLLCCLCVIGTGALFITRPDVVRNTIFNQQQEKEPHIELTQEEIQQHSASYENKIAALGTSQNQNETLIITEEELLASFLKEDTSELATKISLGIHDGYATFSIPLDGIFEGLANNPEAQGQSNVDFSQFQGLLAGLTLNVEVAASVDGKTIVLQDISTGNSLIDSMVTDQLKQSFNNGDFGSLEDISTVQGYTVTKITFQEGQMVLNLSKI